MVVFETVDQLDVVVTGDDWLDGVVAWFDQDAAWVFGDSPGPGWLFNKLKRLRILID